MKYLIHVLMVGLLLFQIVPVRAAEQPESVKETRIEDMLKNLTHLQPQDRKCKKPAEFKLINENRTFLEDLGYQEGYQGKVAHWLKDNTIIKQRDPNNHYHFIDIDGDGVCEVRTETCNEGTVVNPLRDCSDQSWFGSYRWNGKYWAPFLLGTWASTSTYDGSVDMFYLDKDTRRVVFMVGYCYRCAPSVTLGHYPLKGQTKYEMPYSDMSYDRPYQNQGRAIPLLSVHIHRVLDEFKWRVDNCGGEQGFRDDDTSLMEIEQLDDLIQPFMPDPEREPPKDVPAHYVAMVHEWVDAVKKAYAVENPKNENGVCAKRGGYREIKRWE